jgi:hypothetical protein
MKGPGVFCLLALAVNIACGGRVASPAVATPGETGREFSCSLAANPRSSVAASVIQPGVYDVVVAATSGSQARGRAIATLTLANAKAGDVSPRTGEVADDGASLPLRMWGSVVMSFSAVGASEAIARDGSGPDPESTDPVYPGVVLRDGNDIGIEINGWKPPRGTLIPSLDIGSVYNIRREHPIMVDGPWGFKMYILQASAAGFAGNWDAGGMVQQARGYFCARRRG